MPINPFSYTNAFSGVASAGALPWGSGGAGAFQGLGGSPQQAMASLGSSYERSYRDALAMNQSNYNNIFRGYQQSLAAQTSAQQAIEAGYTSLYNSVLGRLETQGASRAQEIRDAYARQAGIEAQRLIDRGLGNATIQSSVNRGIGLDREKALVSNQEAFNRLVADYQSQLGLAGLRSREQGVAANTSLLGRQLDWMNSVNASYPNAGMYSQLAQQYGALSEAERQRRQMGLSGGGGISSMPYGGPGPRVGYVPAPPPRYGGGGYGAEIGGGGGFSALTSGMFGSPTTAGGYNMNPVQNTGGGSFDWAGMGGAVASGAQQAAYGGYGLGSLGLALQQDYGGYGLGSLGLALQQD